MFILDTLAANIIDIVGLVAGLFTIVSIMKGVGEL